MMDTVSGHDNGIVCVGIYQIFNLLIEVFIMLILLIGVQKMDTYLYIITSNLREVKGIQ